MRAAYLELSEEELRRREEALWALLEGCRLCPRRCGVNRLRGERGYCGAGSRAVVSSLGPHFGEEPPLVGVGGSGTIFLAHCNLGCVYCQNYEISHWAIGQAVDAEELAAGMLRLQEMGCHNVNLVTPTHFAPQIVQALIVARRRGLRLPLVWNCGGYESVEALRWLEGVVDIYMPDVKYADEEPARRYSAAPDYFDRAREALREMHRQVGDLQVVGGIARRGLLIRHLVLPGGVAGSERVFRFIARELSPHSYVNVMFQYRPLYRAAEFPEIARRPTLEEYRAALRAARAAGLHRGLEELDG